MQRLITFAFCAALFAAIGFQPGEVRADRTVRANEPVVWFDDIRKTTKELRFAEDDGSGNNRSGLGDGTNPGQGSGTGNSPNQGTDNPNNKKK